MRTDAAALREACDEGLAQLDAAESAVEIGAAWDAFTAALAVGIARNATDTDDARERAESWRRVIEGLGVVR